MENDGTKNDGNEAPKELQPRTSNIQANAKTNRAQRSKAKTNTQKKKKWSLIRYWRSATRKQQVKWVAEGIGGLIALGVLCTYIWSNLQTKWHFEADHRPKLIISRPPEFVQSAFDCTVTENAIHWHTGPMILWVKNIRRGDAIGAFVEGPGFKLVPEKKFGKWFLDDLPSVNEESCNRNVSPKMKTFPVHGGEEVAVNMVQSVGTASLINTKSVTVTFGGPQKDPEASPGEDPERIAVPKDTIYQLYAPICVHYYDDDGKPYGTCRTYRLSVNKSAVDNYAFSCTQTPIAGAFEEIFFGYCEN